MKKFSTNTFHLKTHLPPDQIISTLEAHTLKREVLAMVSTDKDFIGRIGSNSFEVIGSSSFHFLPYGGACVLKGTVNPDSTIALVTTLHKAFRILFKAWVVVMTALFFVLGFWLYDSTGIVEVLLFAIVFPICAVLFRLYLHGAYVLARNKALDKLIILLDALDD